MYNRIQTLDITSNLDGYWKFETISGNTTPDDSGNNRTGILVGGPTLVTGKIDNALSFNGSNQYVSIADNGAFAYTDVITVTCWAYNTNWATLPPGPLVPPETDLLSKKASGGWAIIFNGYAGTGNVGFTANVAANYRTAFSPYTVLTSGWHLFGGTYDGNNVKFYLDGIPKSSVAITGVISYSFPTNCTIIAADAGNLCNPDPGTFLPVYADDARIYHRALIDSEHLALFNYTTCQPPKPNFIVS